MNTVRPRNISEWETRGKPVVNQVVNQSLTQVEKKISLRTFFLHSASPLLCTEASIGILFSTHLRLTNWCAYLWHLHLSLTYISILTVSPGASYFNFISLQTHNHFSSNTFPLSVYHEVLLTQLPSKYFSQHIHKSLLKMLLSSSIKPLCVV